MRTAWRRAALALAALVLLDVALRLGPARDGELLGLVLPPFGRPEHANQRAWLALHASGAPERGPGAFDAELGWTWRPGAVFDDGRASVGAGGARGARVYAERPPPGVLRVLTFGDSFTFGDAIPDEATFQAILERRRPGWEVLNYGVSGYGTDQALLRFRREGPGRGARVVAIGLMLENIGRNVNRYRPLWSPSSGFSSTKPRFALEEGALRLVPQPYARLEELVAGVADGSVLERVRQHEHWIDRPRVPFGRLSVLLRAGAALVAQRERSVPRLWSDPAGEPFRVTVALLEAFRREALAGGADEAVVLVFPQVPDLERARAGDSYWGGLLEELERREVPCIDLAPALLASWRALGDVDPRDTLYYGYHLSQLGNDVVARELERWIDARPALSSPTPPATR